ncbi:MAG TPA: DUF488 family protein [Solirubrobacterales bacterium]|nr:DUF488 family protein [Solirubrobacterales bacterium]HNF83020.1 DUF488 family protein [Solirubrobacterales bacterium]
MAEIRVKRIYEDSSPEDGRRVLVDRLWPRGVKKDRIDEWAKELAPSNELRREFHDSDFDFDEFRARYMVELEGHEDEMRQLLGSTDGPLTLLFGSRNLEQNNATVLAEALGDLTG